MSEGVRLTIEVYWPVDAQRHRTSLGVDRHSRGPHEIATDAQLHHQPHEPEFAYLCTKRVTLILPPTPKAASTPPAHPTPTEHHRWCGLSHRSGAYLSF